MKVFVVAMANEAECVIRHLKDVEHREIWGRSVVGGKLDGESTAVVICGIGKANAAAGTQIALSELKAEMIVNVGTAGGLDPNMAVGDIYRIDKAVEYDYDLSMVNGTAVGVPDEFATAFFELAEVGNRKPAVVATGDRFTDSEADFTFIRETFGATVRDMELGAIAHVCARAKVRLASWKVLTNVVGSGKMTGQFKRNLSIALEKLTAAIPEIWADVGKTR